MLGFKRLVNILVKFLVASSSFCGIKIASTSNVAIGCVEVERAGDDVKVAKREELQSYILEIAQNVERELGCSSNRAPSLCVF